MTLASSGALTATQIQTELGLGSFDMNRTQERNLAGRSSGAYSWDSFNGQTSGGSVALQAVSTGTTVSGVATIASVAIGNAAWNRRVFIAVHWACTTSAVETSISSATIGGIAASVHITYGEGGSSSYSNYGCAIISATVPTGTTATVTVTFTNATVRSVLLTPYRVTGLVSATPVNTVAAFDEHLFAPSSTSCTALLDITATGLAFFAATGSSAGTLNNMSTTGITERQENTLSPEGRTSSGYQTGLATQANRPVTTSWTAGDAGRLRLVTASFRIA